MLPILQGPNKSIKFIVIEMTSLEFLTKISYGVTLLKEDSPNAYVGGITFNLKCLSKSGSVKLGALVNLSYKVSKYFSCSWPHLNTTSFFTISFRGATMVLKSFTKPFIETSKSMKTSYHTNIGGCRPISNCFHLFFIHKHPF